MSNAFLEFENQIKQGILRPEIDWEILNYRLVAPYYKMHWNTLIRA
jgi:hypothetical protein